MPVRKSRILVTLFALSFVLLSIALAQAPAPLADRRAHLRDAIEQEWQYDLKIWPQPSVTRAITTSLPTGQPRLRSGTCSMPATRFAFSKGSIQPAFLSRSC